jgi:hypothetical protein
MKKPIPKPLKKRKSEAESLTREKTLTTLSNGSEKQKQATHIGKLNTGDLSPYNGNQYHP